MCFLICLQCLVSLLNSTRHKQCSMENEWMPGLTLRRYISGLPWLELKFSGSWNDVAQLKTKAHIYSHLERGQLKYKATIFLSSLFADSTLKMKIKLSFSLYCKGETVIIKRDLPTFRSQHMPSKELVNDKNIFPSQYTKKSINNFSFSSVNK